MKMNLQASNIQHQKKHGKGKGRLVKILRKSKNSSSYFDDRIDIEEVTSKIIEDERYDI